MNNRFQRQISGLASLMGVGCGQSITWHDEDLAAILDHQLNTLLICDLAPGARTSEDFEHLQVDSIDWSMTTFAMVLEHPAPPLPLLRMIKDFAKGADMGNEACLPAGVALAIYYAAIAIALVRQRTRITSMSDDELQAGLGWVIRQPWICSKIHHVAEHALLHFGSAG